MTILDQLADHARERAEQAKRKTPLEEIKCKAISLPKGVFAFEKALKKKGFHLSASAKRHLPQKA